MYAESELNCILVYTRARVTAREGGGDKVKEIIRKAIDIVSKVALGAFILLVVLLAGVRLIGLEPHIVLSGSMEPEILTGSLVYVKRTTVEEAQNLQVGDTVTYLLDSKGTKITHKIYEVVGPCYVKNQYGEYVLDENGQPKVAKDDFGNTIVMYTTYGVNNKNESSPTGYTLDGEPGVGNLGSSNVFGKPIFSIPLLGYVAHFVQNPPGKYVTIFICAVLILTTIFSGTPSKKAAENPDGAYDGNPESGNAEENIPTEDDSNTGEDTPPRELPPEDSQPD